MTPEVRLQIADRAYSKYLQIMRDRKSGEDMPSTDIFSESIQQALMEIFPDNKEKTCPLMQLTDVGLMKESCVKEECGWWSTKQEKCGITSLARLEDISNRLSGPIGMGPR